MSVDVLDADRRFFQALLTEDHAALDALLGADFLIVDVAAGGVTGRDEFLAALAEGAVRFTRIEPFPDEVTVRGFGDVAVVVGRTAMALTILDGSPVEVASRYTHVFVRSAGTWRLVSAQGTAIR